MTDLAVDAQITFLYVADLRRSAEFYENILGLSLVTDQGSCRIYRVSGGEGYLGICEREPTASSGDTLIFTFVTDDVDVLVSPHNVAWLDMRKRAERQQALQHLSFLSA